MKKERVKARYVPLRDLSLDDIWAMHVLFEQYYHNVEFSVFFQDLKKKDGVMLLREVNSQNIVGFSTMLTIPFDCDGREVKGLFSGDTIVDRRYWGNREMLRCFVTHLLRLKLKDIRTPLYWLLISKGYKTYLVLSNNFPKHYPHYRKASSSLMASVVDQYCEKLYPDAFCAESKLLKFGDGYQKLKDDVAAISEELKEKNPKIRFFEEKNPTWRDGTELPCVGEVSFSMFWQVLRKIFGEAAKKRMQRTKISKPIAGV